MLELYQKLPAFIDPTALAVGSFSVRWYSLMYLLGILTVYGLLRYRIDKKEALPFGGTESQARILMLDWLLYSAIGMIIGGRIGYAIAYGPAYYLQRPLAIFWPYDFSAGTWTGLFGMSFFGGLIGAVLASGWFLRRRGIDFWRWADFVIPAVPAGYFWGRLGNFLNGELYGRATQQPWGMYFRADGLTLRHPSQLYEAVLEGLFLFVILWSRRRAVRFPGQLLVLYLAAYGLFRFGVEFFREPDPESFLLFGALTIGQLFSALLVAAALVLYQSRRKSYNEES